MKRLTDKIKMVLTNQSGETIMEGLASLLIFAILMMTIAVIIQTSLRITENSIADADIKQSDLNQAIFEQDDTATDAALRFVSKDSAHDIDVSIPVKVSDGDHFTAFAPK